MSNLREIKEGLQYQGTDETVVYTLTTTPWSKGVTPTSPDAKIYEVDGDTFTDKTATLMSGSASMAGEVMTLPAIASVIAGTFYRVEMIFTVSGNEFEAFAELQGER